MRKYLFALTVITACSGVAMAAELKQDRKTTPVPAVAATQMSDAEMDKVTAGGALVITPGPGVTVSLPSTAQGAFANINGFEHSGLKAATLLP